MREIKFRAWDFLNKRIIPWEELQTDSLFTLNEGDVPAMQYTGLKDKNGREIYEGDLVKWDGNWGREVKMNKGCWSVEWRENDFLVICVLDNPEVIGNIYENPELLK